jgi:polysaccharide pyruvyl transferase WcaK-like protein
MNRIYFSTKTQHENLGDGIIGYELLTLMRNYGELTVDNTNSPDWYADFLGLSEIEKISHRSNGFIMDIVKSAIMSRLNISNHEVYLILKPGHIFGTYSIFYNIKYTLFLLFLRILGVKICRFGASLGPFDSKTNTFERVRSYFYKSYTSRDSKSHEYACRIKAHSPEKFPDLAFNIHYCSGVDFDSRNKEIVISFRETIFTGDEDQYTSVIENRVFTADFMKKFGSTIGYLSQVNFDDEYMKKLSDKFGGTTDIACYDNSKSSKANILAIYSDTKIVLSNRLHVLLLAASKGALAIPVISLKKHTKISGIYQDNNLEALIFDLDSENDICEHINYIINNKSYYIDLYEKVFYVNKKSIDNSLNFVFK